MPFSKPDIHALQLKAFPLTEESQDVNAPSDNSTDLTSITIMGG
jgi:hypothetical protein